MRSDILAPGFSRDYERCRAHVHELAAALSDEAFWTKPFGFGNSFGHLVLHLTGNLNYYVGARVAGTGYVRTRDREFTETGRPPKAEVLRDFDAAVDMVLRTIAEQRDEDWASAYSGVGEPDAHNRFDIFLKCAMHFYHHVGQMVYLQKQLHKSMRVTSLAPQFLVDDLQRSIRYYEKLGFTFGKPWDGFYAIGFIDGLELHLKESPKHRADREFRREHEHLDAAAGIDGIDAFFAQCVARDVTIVKPLAPTAWGTKDFYVEDPDGYIICFGGR